MSRLDLTAGERGLLEAYLATAVVSAIIATMAVLHLQGERAAPAPYLAWVAASGGVAGAYGLRRVRDRLGLPGPRGALRAAGAALAASVVAGLVGGSLALPVYGTMFGPFSLAVTLVSMPGLALAWCGCFVLAHMRVALWQRERDSIFRYVPLASG